MDGRKRRKDHRIDDEWINANEKRERRGEIEETIDG